VRTHVVPTICYVSDVRRVSMLLLLLRCFIRILWLVVAFIPLYWIHTHTNKMDIKNDDDVQFTPRLPYNAIVCGATSSVECLLLLLLSHKLNFY